MRSPAEADRKRAAGTLRSGELAALAGVSADTLRFYERRGLLAHPPRDASGYRRYPPDTVDRVHLVRQALAAGFSIDELARILKQRDAGGAPCRDVFHIATTRLHELEERIVALTALRDRLRATLAEWERRLDTTPAGQRAWLLEGLRDTAPARASSSSPAEAGRYSRRYMRRTVR